MGVSQPFRTRERPLLLVTDDEEITRSILVKMVQEIGYDVVEARNGQEALEVYARHQPDMVLLDIMMPGMDGIEACGRLRQTYGENCAPVLMVTSLDDRDSVRRALGAGAYDYIAKPFDVQILRNRVQRLVQMRQFQQELEQRNSMLELLNLISMAVGTTLDANEILERVLYLTGHALGVTSAYMCDLDLMKQTTTVLAEYFGEGANPKELESDLGVGFPLHEMPYLVDLLAHPLGYAVIQMDEEDYLSQQRQKHYGSYGVKTVILVPLQVEGELLGYLEYWETRFRRSISPIEAQLIRSFSGQISVMLKNAMLHERLQGYSAQLEEQNRELVAYGHTIAHDLKNPLHVITSYSELARIQINAGHYDKVLGYVERVELVGMKMSRMVDQLLRFATVRDQTVEISPLDMVGVVQEVLLRFEDVIQAQGITVHIAQDLPPGVGNAGWIEEVIANLVSNAIKYIGGHNQEPSIRIWAEPQGRMIRYAVQDNGIGIAPDDQKRLFEMFVRAANVGTVEGLGLGLSIVLRIIKRLGGEVGVESEEGVGSTFWFTLPAA